MKKPFTEQEEEIMNLLVEAHNKFVEMEQMHPDDMREWVDGIHKCQNVLKGRVVTRDYPDVIFNSAVGKWSTTLSVKCVCNAVEYEF